MTETITWAFTHKIASRSDGLITAECGTSMRDLGWIDQGTNCPTCYPGTIYPGTIYPASPLPDAPVTYRKRTA